MNVQGPKFVTDDEIERIKAKIEEDNRAIAALESKKFGKKIFLKSFKRIILKGFKRKRGKVGMKQPLAYFMNQ